jgi:hypothetical protein
LKLVDDGRLRRAGRPGDRPLSGPGGLGATMLEESEIAMNLLSFRNKNFSFERTANVAGEQFAVFHRTETESEAKLRPQLIRLWVVTPVEWLIYLEAEDALVLGQDGKTPGPAIAGQAIEAAAEPGEFDERGIAWVRHARHPEVLVYVPRTHRDRLLSDEGLRVLDIE